MDTTYLETPSAWCNFAREPIDEDSRALTRTQWTMLRYRTRFSVCAHGHYAATFPPASFPVGGYASFHQSAASHVCAVESMPMAASCDDTWPASVAFGQIVHWDRACAG